MSVLFIREVNNNQDINSHVPVAWC